MLIQNDVEDNLMLAIMAGVFTSKRILELGITFSSIGRRVYQFDHVSIAKSLLIYMHACPRYLCFIYSVNLLVL